LKINLKNTAKAGQLEAKILETQLKLKENEVNYLKMQIHPHFLFNTLNTMYGLALKKADETPEMILKLSNLLDYLLYQIDKPFVHLEEEVSHIKDYISLEELRFSDRLKVNLIEEYQTKHNQVIPMLLLPFVENSFKHGQLENGELHIDIHILSVGNNIQFKIKNKRHTSEDTQPGIGLVNIKKRLSILYENQHELKINTKNGIFEVDLILKTNTHV
jgi:LytS/YehU family sensor histidine kinase